MINNPWVICGVGTAFCIIGIYLFHRNAFEENKKVIQPVLIILAGVILIAIGTAKYMHLID